MRELQQVVKRCGASLARLEHGELRVDVNVSVTQDGEARERVELKNLNSLRAVRLACDFELRRQAQVYENGDTVQRETLGWNGSATYVMRDKGRRGRVPLLAGAGPASSSINRGARAVRSRQLEETTPRAARRRCVAAGVDRKPRVYSSTATSTRSCWRLLKGAPTLQHVPSGCSARSPL